MVLFLVGILLGSYVGYLIVKYVFNKGESLLDEIEKTSDGDIINELEERE